MSMPQNTANNVDEFNAQAKAFVAKAKEKGVSNTAIANTIQLMYSVFNSQAENTQDDWELKEIDGESVLFNPATGEIKDTGYMSTQAGLEAIEGQVGQTSEPGQVQGVVEGINIQPSPQQEISDLSTGNYQPQESTGVAGDLNLNYPNTPPELQELERSDRERGLFSGSSSFNPQSFELIPNQPSPQGELYNTGDQGNIWLKMIQGL